MGGHLAPINPLGHQSPPYRRSNPLAPGTWESFRIASAAWCVQPTVPAKQTWCFSIFRTYISKNLFLNACTAYTYMYVSRNVIHLCIYICIIYIYMHACCIHIHLLDLHTYIINIKLQKWITLCNFLGDFPIF
jgi:hypothetical protein